MHAAVFKLGSRQDAGLRMRAQYAPGVPYLIPDKLAEAMASFAGLESACPYQPPNPWLRRSQLVIASRHPLTLRPPRWLICTIGGLGDYLAMLPALLTLQRRAPTVAIDVCTEPVGFDLLCCGGFRGARVDYPLERSTAETYDAALLIDDITDHPRFRELDLIDVFADLIGVEPPYAAPVITAGSASRDRMQIKATGRQRVGVQLRGSSPLRSYPVTQLGDLLRLVVRAGYDVHLFGEEGDCEIASSPRLYNWCGKTAHIQDLIALVEQMDLIIAPDSFLAHLGGMMHKPTLAMFTTVPSALRSRYYPTITALEPPIGCNPCFGRGHCPAGFDHCLVWDQPAVSPVEILARVEEILQPGGFDTAAPTPCNRVNER